jgi:hypothetical protein
VRWSLLLAIFLCLGRAAIHAQATTQVKLTDPRKETPSQIQADPATFGWQMFVALNWPELPGYRGIPNPRARIGQRGATVWESYKNASEIYLSHGQRPPAWEVNNELPVPPVKGAHPTKQQLAAFGPVDSTWIHYLSETVMIDGQNVCDAASNIVRYDVRGDRPYYDFVVNNPSGHELFNIQGQEAALTDPNFVFSFPTDTVEVKASWRILEAGEDPSRYWTAIGVYRDIHNVVRSARIGLTGLHIISKSLPDWVWITFEQVDNATKTFTYKLGEKMVPIGANPNYNNALTPINQMYQAALTGTKWQYYALMNAQTKFVNESQQPTLSSNTQMETYFQHNSSCITCHKLASIGPLKDPRLQLFYPLLPYVGDQSFQTVAQQQYPSLTFKDMDFAWSLRNAQYKKTTASTNKSAPAVK